MQHLQFSRVEAMIIAQNMTNLKLKFNVFLKYSHIQAVNFGVYTTR